MAESTESSGVYDLLAWLEVNKTRVRNAIIVLLVVIVAVAFYMWNKTDSEKKASNALLALPSGQFRTAPATPDDLLKVSNEYSNTKAAERAAILAAGALFSKGQYAEAKAQFEKFLSDHPSSDLKGQAAYGLATSLEAQGNADAAIAKYREVSTEFKDQNVAFQSKLAMARIYEAQNKPEEALKIYSDLQTSAAHFDVWRGEAAERRERVISAHPELAQKFPAPGEQIIEVTTPPDPNQPASTNK